MEMVLILVIVLWSDVSFMWYSCLSISSYGMCIDIQTPIVITIVGRMVQPLFFIFSSRGVYLFILCWTFS